MMKSLKRWGLIAALVAIPLVAYAGIVPRSLEGAGTPTDEFCLTYESTNSRFQWQDCGDAVTFNGLLDAAGAVDQDYGSADITDHTFVSDGGTVIIDGSITMDAGTTLFAGGLIDATGAVDMDYGSVDITDHTFITDGTGDAEIVLPENSLGPDEVAVLTQNIVLCGQNANSGTIYGGPADDSYDGGGGEYAIGGTVCDGLDNATEATADAPISIAANNAMKVMGMSCTVDTSGSNGVTLTLRSAEAGLTPALACTIATGNTTCATNTATTTDIAAGATLAVQSVTTEDLSTNDFWCVITVGIKQ